MSIGTFQIGTPRRRGEGLRLGTVRFLPRGVRKSQYAKHDYFDVWLPILAPSRKLLAWARPREWDDKTRHQFFARYRRELLGNTETRQVLMALAAMGKQMNISVGCYCQDESRCHRSELIKQLHKAGSKEA